MTTAPRPADTLAAALPREMVRVTALIPHYEAVPLGWIAATLMRALVRGAQEAIESGDVIRMIRAYEDLRGYVG